jgi:trimethylamine--corrinoid protein Co-methyltransferase
VLSEDRVEAVHQAALAVLAEDGIRVLLPEARARFAAAGASVDESDQMVRIGPDLVGEAVNAAPASFEVVPVGVDRGLIFGDTSVVMSPVAGPPHATDLRDGRRAGTLRDFEDFLRLTQHYDVIHTACPFVEPQDVPIEFRHLEVTRSLLTLSDKLPFIYARGIEKVADCLEMIRIAHGIDEAGFRAAPRCWTVINTNSPRQLDVPMCMGILQFAEAGQVVVVTPFTLAGAMAPVTVAGAVTLQHAEALAGITLAQIAAPGAPTVYGGFTSNVDMRSGSPAFGTPEAVKAALASGQLARRIGLPWRSSGVSTSNAPDAQAGYETMMNMMGAVFGGANQIVHAAGWVESGLAASFEKFILDVEMVQMFAEIFRPLASTDDDLAREAISTVDPGRHFFDSPHTLERYASAFYEPIVFSRRNYEQWAEEGAPTAAERASKVWRSVVADFEAPPIDAAIREELDEFVARRTAEGGALPPA